MLSLRESESSRPDCTSAASQSIPSPISTLNKIGKIGPYVCCPRALLMPTQRPAPQASCPGDLDRTGAIRANGQKSIAPFGALH
jgi:hypothetical protein